MIFTTSHKATFGFTLVETLVAISILLLVIIGPLTVAQKGIQNAYYANEQIAAVFYAQEAIEAVRISRDNLSLEAYKAYVNNEDPVDTADWVGDVHNNCGSSVCYLAYDSEEGTFSPCTSGDCSRIGDTQFTRIVTVGVPVNDNVPVSVSVEWSSQIHNTDKEVILQTWIYDHYKRYEN